MLFIYSTTNNGCEDKVAVSCSGTAITLNSMPTERVAKEVDVGASAAEAELVDKVAFDLS